MAVVPIQGLRNQYNAGNDSTQGVNNTRFYYEKVGIKASNAKAVFSQFAGRNWVLPDGHGFEFRISRFFNGYDRYITDPEFAKKGWLTGRDIRAVAEDIQKAVLPESAGAQNYKSISKITISAVVQEFGAMLEYSDRVEYFSEDQWYSRFYQALGYWAGQTHEDQLMLSLLESTTTMYSGVATSINDVGLGVSLTGEDITTVSPANGVNTFSDNFARSSYDLFRKVVLLFKKYRAEPIKTIITGSDKIGSQVVGASFFGLASSDVIFDLQTLVNPYDVGGGAPALAWITPEMYGAAAKLAEGESGALARSNVRFIEVERLVEYYGQGYNTPIYYAGAATGDFTLAGGAGVSQGYVDGLVPTQASNWVGIQGSNTYYTGKLKKYQWTVDPTTGNTYTAADVQALHTKIFLGRGAVNYAKVVISGGNFTTTIVTSKSPTALVGASATDFYILLTEYYTVSPIIFPTKDSFATIGLKGKNKLEWQNVPPKKAVSLANPYGTVGFMSIRFWYAGLIYKPENLVVAYVASTDIL
jgi:N4-gp56 family major capsid protein